MMWPFSVVKSYETARLQGSLLQKTEIPRLSVALFLGPSALDLKIFFITSFCQFTENTYSVLLTRTDPIISSKSFCSSKQLKDT